MKFNDLMIDFETGSTAANGVILSLGAVHFSPEGEIAKHGFYASISLESNLELGRVFDEGTLKWWMKQSPEAQRVWHEPKEHIAAAFQSFTEFVTADRTEDELNNLCVWSNGADFDIPMAASVYRQLGMPMPWSFWNHRCFRTYKNLPGAKRVPRPDVGVKHNALDDAIAQVHHFHAIHKALFMVADEAAAA